MSLPNYSIGVLGSGQLGRMFAQEAIQLGYTVHVYSPDKNSPAGKVGAIEWVGAYLDFGKLQEFLKSIQALTFEFENIPLATLDYIEENFPLIHKNGCLRPNVRSIKIAQDRILEKEYFASIGLTTVDYIPIIHGKEDISHFSMPAILKTTKLGYDGKGQWKFASHNDIRIFLEQNPPSFENQYILESFFPYDYEISVIYARNHLDQEFIFPPALNTHENSILDTTEFPAQIPEAIHNRAIQFASSLGRSLEYEGVMGIEFFVKGDELVVNEFAPRPHNSGHYTQNASDISQFGLQLRILAGLNLPEKNNIKPCLMKNILGDNYEDALLVCFELLSKDSRYHLHLYQKDSAKNGRKMGHINFVGNKNEVDPRFFHSI